MGAEAINPQMPSVPQSGSKATMMTGGNALGLRPSLPDAAPREMDHGAIVSGSSRSAGSIPWASALMSQFDALRSNGNQSTGGLQQSLQNAQPTQNASQDWASGSPNQGGPMQQQALQQAMQNRSQMPGRQMMSQIAALRAATPQGPAMPMQFRTMANPVQAAYRAPMMPRMAAPAMPERMQAMPAQMPTRPSVGSKGIFGRARIPASSVGFDPVQRER